MSSPRCAVRRARCTSAALGLLLLAVVPSRAAPPPVVRLNQRLPIVSQSDFERAGVPDEGVNLSGPSAIRLPDWLPRWRRADPSANYYLYFADHDGAYLRVAWAAEIEGPWTLYGVGPEVPPGQRGALDLGDARSLDAGDGLGAVDHIASPHVDVDDAAQRFLLYFHSPSSLDGSFTAVQHAFIAISRDGLRFDSPELRARGEGLRPVLLADAYLRPFRHAGALFGIANRGSLYQALDPEQPWERFGGPPGRDAWRLLAGRDRNPLIDDLRAAGLLRAGVEVRHPATRVVGDRLDIYYTRIGDSPERILYSAIDLSHPDPSTWDASYPPVELLRPEEPWEGANDPQRRSRIGRAPENVKELRDPNPFRDADGRWYLFYAGRGEDALGVARLHYPLPLYLAVELERGRQVDGFRLLERRWLRLALRGETGLDLAEVDSASLVLGDAAARPERIRTLDIDGDGRLDLWLRFSARELAIPFGAESLCLRGTLRDATPFEGCDRIDSWRLAEPPRGHSGDHRGRGGRGDHGDRGDHRGRGGDSR